MKVFPWLLLLSFEAICLTCWLTAGLTELVYRDQFKDTGFPTGTWIVLAAKEWFPAFPVPWLIYAIALTRRREVSVPAVLVFAGTICLSCCLFLCWVVIGLLMPYYGTHIFVHVRTVIGK
ncbi:MAG: hypothetical protein U1G08_00025 [Verrucomicrobiota bacterium]